MKSEKLVICILGMCFIAAMVVMAWQDGEITKFKRQFNVEYDAARFYEKASESFGFRIAPCPRCHTRVDPEKSVKFGFISYYISPILNHRTVVGEMYKYYEGVTISCKKCDFEIKGNGLKKTVEAWNNATGCE